MRNRESPPIVVFAIFVTLDNIFTIFAPSKKSAINVSDRGKKCSQIV